jgi:hypothetical protein
MSTAPRPGRVALYADPINPNEVQVYNVVEVARMLGVGEQTVRRAIKSGGLFHGDRQIKHLKVCNRLVFPRAAVHAALAAD